MDEFSSNLKEYINGTRFRVGDFHLILKKKKAFIDGLFHIDGRVVLPSAVTLQGLGCHLFLLAGILSYLK